MRKPLAILLALVLLALSGAAMAIVLADVYRREAATLIQKWNWPDDEPPPAAQWDQVHRYLWLASRLAPFDAKIQTDLGELYELRVVESTAPEASAVLDRALDHYRQSLALRPSWPQAWVDVAMLKVSRQQLDAEFAFAMRRAMELGPWDTRVQATIASGGLLVWEKLPATLQSDVEHTVARGLANRSRLMPLVARRFGLLYTDKGEP